MSPQNIDTIIQKTLKKIGFKCAPALVTIMGDSILPRSDKIWISMLIEMAQLFDIDSRAVRTSMYRLAKDNWIQSYKQGRKSYYTLTHSTQQRFKAVETHLYGLPILTTVHWCRVLVLDRKHKNKDKFAQELRWLGFGTLAGGTYIHPNANISAIKNIVTALHMQDSIVISTGEKNIFATAKGLQKMGAVCWNLQALEKQSKQFIKTFTPFKDALESHGDISEYISGYISPAQAFSMRTLVIHEYRRMMLKYPILPKELLPFDWAWLNAYALCASIYKQTLQVSEDYITDLGNALPEPIPKTKQKVYNRFPSIC